MAVAKMLAMSPGLARERAVDGATVRQRKHTTWMKSDTTFMPAIPLCILPQPPIKKTSLET
jgi:hypothetical protein